MTTHKAFLHKQLTYDTIGAAMEVHKVLGPGFVESVYEATLAHTRPIQAAVHARPECARRRRGATEGGF